MQLFINKAGKDTIEDTQQLLTMRENEGIEINPLNKLVMDLRIGESKKYKSFYVEFDENKLSKEQLQDLIINVLRHHLQIVGAGGLVGFKGNKQLELFNGRIQFLENPLLKKVYKQG